MNELNFDNWICPLPLRDYPKIVLGHGGGGKLSNELIENLFLPAFANKTLEVMGDSASIDLPEILANGSRLAFSTDSFVVNPLFFPGGNIGDLAINGTVNDIAMSGAKPLFMSAGFIIEEGFEIKKLGEIVSSMSRAAKIAGVRVVAGDTKVVERGKGDGVFINTSGIGVIPDGVNIAPNLAEIGDVVIVSGEVGLHGIAIMSIREGLEFDAPIWSDCAPLHELVSEMLSVTKEIHVLRDATRGGVASVLNEIAKSSNVGIRLEESKLPVPREVSSACEMLGLDPLYVANEGKLVAILPRRYAAEMLEKMHSHELGKKADIIGEIVGDHTGMVVTKTAIGGTRVVDMQLGEQLPRIC
ncbi:MAG: hydrogenase expression/formation protein HypE [Pyrinomonadaceae bacterium]